MKELQLKATLGLFWNTHKVLHPPIIHMEPSNTIDNTRADDLDISCQIHYFMFLALSVHDTWWCFMTLDDAWWCLCIWSASIIHLISIIMHLILIYKHHVFDHQESKENWEGESWELRGRETRELRGRETWELRGRDLRVKSWEKRMRVERERVESWEGDRVISSLLDASFRNEILIFESKIFFISKYVYKDSEL